MLLTRTLATLLLLATCSLAQRTYDCGNLGQRSCGYKDWEYYNMRWGGSHSCEPDLEEKDGVCVNRNRIVASRPYPWLSFALSEQLYGVSGHQPINRIPWLGTHNAFSSLRQGFNNPIYGNQVFSVTDQLTMGSRHLELDPQFYTTGDADLEVRLCHSGNAYTCLSPGYGTRLFGYLLYEIRQWLKSNPDEVIILKLDEKNVGVIDSNGYKEMYVLLDRYLGDLAYPPPILFTRWPTLNEVRNAGKRVVIMQHDTPVTGDGKSLVWDASILIQASNWPKNQDFSNCVSYDGVPQSQRPPATWWDVAEGRSLSNSPLIEGTGLMLEPEVRRAVNCGISIIGLDYLNALSEAPVGPRTDPDFRVESTIWSFAKNDFGTAGPMALSLLTDDRWHSMPELQSKAYACAAVRPTGDANDVRDWKFTSAKGVWNKSIGNSACVTEFGAGYEFTFPRNGYQNADLVKKAKTAGIADLWIAYSTINRPAVAASSTKLTFTMTPGGALPQAQSLNFYGPAGSQASADVKVNWLTVIGVVPPVQMPASAVIPVSIGLNANAAALPGGVYTTPVRLYATVNGGVQNVPIFLDVNVTLIVKRPVTLTVTPESTQFNYGMPVKINGQLGLLNPKATGTITFVRTSAPDPSATGIAGAVQGQTASANFTGLAPGVHQFAASYSGDTYTLASESNEVSITVLPRLPVTPSPLSFTMDAGGAVPAGATLTIGGSPSGTVTATKPCSWLTATVQGNTQIAVALVQAQAGALAPGSYSCDITVSDSLGSTTVPVTLAVRTTLSASAGSLQFLLSNGGLAREVFVTTPQNKTIPLTATTNKSWISVVIPAGQTPTNPVISVDSTGLPLGLSTGQVTFQSPLSSNTAVVNVTVEVAGETKIDSVPSGRRVYVDSAPYTAPAIFTWSAGSQHSITTDTFQQPDSSTRFKFLNWSQGGPHTQAVTALSAGATYKANFETQYSLSTDVIPSAGGSVSRDPAGDGSGFYAAGSNVQLTATANPGYFFNGFIGDVTSAVSQAFVWMTAPKGTVARFAQSQPVLFAIDSNVSTSITVQGVSYPVPGQIPMVPGVSYTIAAPSEVTGGTGARWVFSNWGGLSANASFTYIAASSPATLTLRYQQQFLVTTVVSPSGAGAVTGGGWYSAGAPVTLQAAANSGFNFTGFSGGGLTAGSGNPASIPSLSGAVQVVGNYSATGVPALFASSSGARTDGPAPGQRTVPILIRNVGSGPAGDASITGVVNVLVTSGSGQVSSASVTPISLGTIAAGGQAISALIFNWPATATRIQFTVRFSANNGAYEGSTTLNLIR